VVDVVVVVVVVAWSCRCSSLLPRIVGGRGRRSLDCRHGVVGRFDTLLLFLLLFIFKLILIPFSNFC